MATDGENAVLLALMALTEHLEDNGVMRRSEFADYLEDRKASDPTTRRLFGEIAAYVRPVLPLAPLHIVSDNDDGPDAA